MNVIWHDNGSEEVACPFMLMVAGSKDNVASPRRQVLSFVCGKGDEVRPGVLLNVRQVAFVVGHGGSRASLAHTGLEARVHILQTCGDADCDVDRQSPCGKTFLFPLRNTCMFSSEQREEFASFARAHGLGSPCPHFADLW